MFKEYVDGVYLVSYLAYIGFKAIYSMFNVRLFGIRINLLNIGLFIVVGLLIKLVLFKTASYQWSIEEWDSWTNWCYSQKPYCI